MNLYNSLLTGISASSLAQFIQSFLYTTTQVIVWQKNINLISNVNLISLLYLKPFNGSLLFVQIHSPEHCKLHDLALSLILHKTNYSFLSSCHAFWSLYLECPSLFHFGYLSIVSLTKLYTPIIWVYLYLILVEWKLLENRGHFLFIFEFPKNKMCLIHSKHSVNVAG